MDIPTSAARHAPLSVLRLLLSYGADFCRSNALHAAAARGRVDTLRWLLDEQGFPINQRELEYEPELFREWKANSLGTALHKAIEADCLDGARYVLDRGIDFNLPDSEGFTSLDRARQYEFAQMVSFLEEREPK